MLSRISQSKNRADGPDDLFKNAKTRVDEQIAVVFQEYEKALRNANALDFDDLLLETVRLLRHDAATRETWNRRLGYVMIDEYQDTNRPQYQLMRLLTTEHDNVCVVGDEDQSIYSWRGADINNILDFEKDYRNAKVIRLEQNYRSTKNILEAASAVVANNTQRKGKWLWTESGAGDLLTMYPASDGENEALFIADSIEKILASHPDWHVAILYRTNSQSRQIEEALRRYGRKYSVVGGFSFYQRAEVKDIVAYLKLAIQPSDSVSLMRVINTPARGIGRSTMDQVDQYAAANNLSRWNALVRMIDENLFPNACVRRDEFIPAGRCRRSRWRWETSRWTRRSNSFMNGPVTSRCWKPIAAPGSGGAAGERGGIDHSRGGGGWSGGDGSGLSGSCGAGGGRRSVR